MADTTENDMMGMSDEDIMNMAQPPAMADVEEKPEVIPETPAEPDKAEIEKTPADPSGSEEKPKAEETSENKEEGVDEANPLNKSDEDLEKEKKPKEKAKEETPKADADKATDENKGEAKPADAPAVPVDYKAAYEQIMAPFKASGRTMQMKTPEEVVALMQRGADYTRKMQALKPSLKIMKMLENNGLLDEAKLSHFIDLDKKDPAAIAKFLKDKQVDPLDLDMSEETEYKPGNHAVSDEEMRFNTVLEDVQSTPTGKETVQIIDKQWDRTSQGRVFKEPQILKLIDTHREQGLYEQITGEMDRLKLLGVIPEDAVFLDAYKSVGDELHKHGRLLLNGKPTNQMKQENPANPPAPAPKKEEQPRQVIETRPAKPKPAASNGDAARAAAPTRTTPAKTTAADFNPLSMSDEEFEKQAGSFRL